MLYIYLNAFRYQIELSWCVFHSHFVIFSLTRKTIHIFRFQVDARQKRKDFVCFVGRKQHHLKSLSIAWQNEVVQFQLKKLLNVVVSWDMNSNNKKKCENLVEMTNRISCENEVISKRERVTLTRCHLVWSIKNRFMRFRVRREMTNDANALFDRKFHFPLFRIPFSQLHLFQLKIHCHRIIKFASHSRSHTIFTSNWHTRKMRKENMNEKKFIKKSTAKCNAIVTRYENEAYNQKVIALNVNFSFHRFSLTCRSDENAIMIV